MLEAEGVALLLDDDVEVAVGDALGQIPGVTVGQVVDARELSL